MNNISFLIVTVFCLSSLAACGTIDKPTQSLPNPQHQTDVGADQINAFRQKITDVAEDDFGTFMVEMHRANQQLEQAQVTYDRLVNGGSAHDATTSTLGSYLAAGEVALDQALNHRDNAEQAFNRIMSVLEESSISEELQDRLAYLESIHVSKGDEIPPLNVYFGFSSARMNRAEEKKIDNLVRGLEAYPVFALRLVGYADTVGSKTRNLRLAEQRNYSVIRSLHRAGMPVNTLVSVAVGEVDGPDEVRNPESRRVEIISYVHGRDPRIAEQRENQRWQKELQDEEKNQSDETTAPFRE